MQSTDLEEIKAALWEQASHPFDTRAASRTTSVIPDAPQAPPSVAPVWEARMGEFDPRLGIPSPVHCLHGGT